MAVIKWTPFLEPFEAMDKMMEEWHHGSTQGFAPAVDVYETKDAVVVETPLAGVETKDIHISIENDILTIKGEMSSESEVDDKNYYRKEVRSGSFFRSVALPAHVLSDKASAESHEGMLKISIPKAPPAKAKPIAVTIKKPKGKK